MGFSRMKHGKGRKRQGREGFTLIELMVVIVILGVLAGLIVPQFMDEPQKARVVKAKMQMESISTSLKKFYIDNGFYPTTEQGLEALVRKPSTGRTPKNYASSGYLPKVPKDPWGTQYIYISPGKHGKFDLSSYGADGVSGGKDGDADVNSWQID
ncbi:type II secretion system protein GspG [Pseudodesulfovibrio nedwellii]|uniref:Type II secretion system core protein G n=1 Tax=Pseudodesulfovibrio nedwellii TaxID=2973072 RepID=A0ABM8B3P3_9BACT|nr:type II secretion system major pseudopilin GspG [Pseudodesulfovibrio nedwellii]BDQ38450.1 type II secretion system protein GspG [Pseudodesulfovibrio nedwellii]